MISRIIALFALSLFASESQAKPVVAVFDIQDSRETKNKFSPKTLADLTEYLGNLLTETEKYTVIPNSALKEALSTK
jgi:hypothetical protein